MNKKKYGYIIFINDNEVNVSRYNFMKQYLTFFKHLKSVDELKFKFIQEPANGNIFYSYKQAKRVLKMLTNNTVLNDTFVECNGERNTLFNIRRHNKLVKPKIKKVILSTYIQLDDKTNTVKICEEW